jgi:hypothetical protein
VPETSRPLTPGERNLAASVFGDAVDYDPVRVLKRKYWPFHGRRIAMAPNGSLYFHPEGELWSEDFATAPLHRQGLFVHEMTHVWQHQKGIFLPLARHPFCRYSYTLKPGWPLKRYGLEQQAEIVRHAFLLREKATVPGAPTADLYWGLLPFSPVHA